MVENMFWSRSAIRALGTPATPRLSTQPLSHANLAVTQPPIRRHSSKLHHSSIHGPPQMSPPSSAKTINAVASRAQSRPQRWDNGIPPLLRPLARAYLVGYGFTVGPRVFALVLRHLTRHIQRRRKDGDGSVPSRTPQPPLVESLTKVLVAGAQVHRFPTFCAALVGGSTLLEPVLRDAFARFFTRLSITERTRLSRWLSTAIAAWFSIQLLQKPFAADEVPHGPPGQVAGAPGHETASSPAQYYGQPQAGRTLDLTLFAATRALDVIIGELWSQRRAHRSPSSAGTRTRTLDDLASTLADPLIFAVTSGIALWNWFYSPEALPPSYNKWISSAARVDDRLVVALQRMRDGTMRYGEDLGQAPLLEGMCRDYGWPTAWGDPHVSIPFPCEVVHMGVGPSCELHALSRFRRAWVWSMKTYVPLQMVMFLARARGSKSLRRDLVRTLLSASRSSAFLGAFITLFYYGVCLARTRVGPRLLGTSLDARHKLDGGICVGTGCLLCGWSVLIESASRRKELALFVAPRAVATMLPRRYPADREWIERAAFAASTAVVFTCVLENKSRVRGVLGNVLRMVLAA